MGEELLWHWSPQRPAPWLLLRASDGQQRPILGSLGFLLHVPLEVLKAARDPSSAGHTLGAPTRRAAPTPSLLVSPSIVLGRPGFLGVSEWPDSSIHFLVTVSPPPPWVEAEAALNLILKLKSNFWHMYRRIYKAKLVPLVLPFFSSQSMFLGQTFATVSIF